MNVLTLGGNGTLDMTERERELARDFARRAGLGDRPRKDNGCAGEGTAPGFQARGLRMIKRSALTPTDLLHVRGEFTRWDTGAAKRALEIFAAMFGRPQEEVLELAMKALTRRLFDEIVRRELYSESRRLHELPKNWKIVLDKAFADDGKALTVKFSLRRPIVAIGAPAQALVPRVAAHIASEVIVPEHADVANAVGAIGSEIVVREEILIRPGQMSNYVLHGSGERIEFSELDRATQKAIEISRARARKLAD